MFHIRMLIVCVVLELWLSSGKNTASQYNSTLEVYCRVKGAKGNVKDEGRKREQRSGGSVCLLFGL